MGGRGGGGRGGGGGGGSWKGGGGDAGGGGGWNGGGVGGWNSSGPNTANQGGWNRNLGGGGGWVAGGGKGGKGIGQGAGWNQNNTQGGGGWNNNQNNQGGGGDWNNNHGGGDWNNNNRKSSRKGGGKGQKGPQDPGPDGPVIAGKNGHLHRLCDSRHGTQASAVTGLAMLNNQVVASSMDGTVVQYRPEGREGGKNKGKGFILFQDTESTLSFAPNQVLAVFVHNGAQEVLFCGLSDGTVQCFANGGVHWTLSTGNGGASCLTTFAVGGRTLLAVGTESGAVCVFDMADTAAAPHVVPTQHGHLRVVTWFEAAQALCIGGMAGGSLRSWASQLNQAHDIAGDGSGVVSMSVVAVGADAAVAVVFGSGASLLISQAGAEVPQLPVGSCSTVSGGVRGAGAVVVPNGLPMIVLGTQAHASVYVQGVPNKGKCHGHFSTTMQPGYDGTFPFVTTVLPISGHRFALGDSAGSTSLWEWNG